MLKKSSKKKGGASPRQLAKALARFIEEKKGEDIIVFDLRGISPITDYFVIASGLSDIHIKTIANYLLEHHQPDHIEGMEAATWVLLDFIDVIVHLFQKETREFYGLERLWGDAPRVNF
ncbi:ribosome silencing factor [candidate division WOR-3 bacterium 4484_100]|uniref:Ribosomal silencing factor RsfS n=1 Tax=candidate division WOR-3 bacterium 4484_100 TaxID=1936077 RepID=A0A1V4QH41_UNCW3|nr:MAG: ribosome silencing factor [candidate division WOR-3 bacterium 4484_100]